MNDNVEEVKVLRELFDSNFGQWVDENLEQVLDDRFKNWAIDVGAGANPIMLYVELNESVEYGEDLDSFLEYQVLGIEFLESLGLKPETGYDMRSLLEVLSDYILVYSINVL